MSTFFCWCFIWTAILGHCKIYRIGIDIEQYRATIGNRFKRIRSFKGKCKNDQLLAEPIFTYETVFFLVATLFFVYFFPLYTSVHILAINSPLFKGVSFLSHGNEGHENCSISLSPIILFITVVISTKKCANFLSIFSRVFYSYLTLSISLLVILLNSTIIMNVFILATSYSLCFTIIAFGINQNMRFLKQKRFLALITSLVFLIVISNMSLLNPGPQTIQGLNCFFHNIHGLVTYNTLGLTSPDLNITKILELQAYIFENKPDIIILNETWLKPAIKSEEIIPGGSYKIFRRDMSPDSHPTDPLNPKKFKVNGGGVLIAVKNSLDLHPKVIASKSQAEILSIEVTLSNKKKVSLSTLYRVGTLGLPNLTEVKQHLIKVFKDKKYKNNFIVGDFDLDTVNWQNYTATSNVQTSYLNLFLDLGLTQIISEPTHKCGNILDLLLTDSPLLVTNQKIHSPGAFIKSDHSPISFTLSSLIARRKAITRKIFNFKKANWKTLNNDLKRVDWHYLLSSEEAHTGWELFKNKFLILCDKHIPKITIKESFQPPWYDSEVFKLNKKKENFRKKFKETNSQNHYLKYSSLRKDLKNLVKAKMRSNFDDELSPNTITKKFWSYVKSSSKSHTLPQRMYYGECIRNDSEGIANLFNEHFFNQFSDKSKYDIDINFDKDPWFDFSISESTICNLLRSLNSNKSKGPDKWSSP